MAERSFATEVQALRLAAGEEFEGEGILAITKALLQAGVAYIGGYQGAPVSHLMDVLGDAGDILAELGVKFETSANEATAAAMLAASINYPLRGAVTWKSTVGTNVAADALSNLASAGVQGGTLIVLGEDYGEGASIMQERTHAFAMKSQMWLLDPRPNLPLIVDLVERGFELSEASNTPVMLMLRIRACHLVGRFRTRANRRPTFTLEEALQTPVRTFDNIILPPSTFAQEQQKVSTRWPRALQFIREHRLNETFAADARDIGLVLQGGLYNTVLRALERMGLADVFGATQVPLQVLNVTYPLVPEEISGFAHGKRAVLVIEEGQPDYLEQAIGRLVQQAGLAVHVCGKGELPMAGEYTAAVVSAGIRAFVQAHDPALLAAPQGADPRPLDLPAVPLQPHGPLALKLPARPPGLCTGCPERPLFAAIKLLEREQGKFHVSADIGCHSFGTLPPFGVGASIMGYGLGAAGGAAFNLGGARKPLNLMGDGGFWHNGLTSGIGNAVFNQHDGVTIVIDNGYSAATGGQAIPSSTAPTPGHQGANTIENAVRGVGVRWLRSVSTYDMQGVLRTLRAALADRTRTPKVIVARGECQLNRQRRIAPQVQAALRAGARVVRQRFGIDAALCTGDHSCIRLSGCPSLTLRPSADPLRDTPIATVDNTCVGCGVCGEVAHAATLCPSFYRADVITHPTLWDRLKQRVRQRVISLLEPT